MAYPFGNDPAKIEGYRRFWNREAVDRPLVGFSLKTWFPMHEFAASRAWRDHYWLTVDMIHPPDFVEDQERLLREGETIEDDIIRGACPSQAVMWLPPLLGAPLRILEESTLAPDLDLSWGELDHLYLDPNHPWLAKYLDFVRVLVEASGGRYPVSHGTMSGPSDLAAIFRGHGNMIHDFYDAPERLRDLFFRMMELFCTVRDAVWEIIPLWHGGYFDAQYSLWAPGPIVRMQEDATGLFSPKLYRELLQPVDREWASRYECAFIHLHSTSNFVLDAILEVDEIAAYEYNRDVSGPSLEEMIPYYAKIQNAGKPLLIRGSFTPDEVRLLLDYLDSRGLYLYIMVSSPEEIEPLKRVLGM
ncbi:MAG: hypothetical protein ACOYEW_14440 [Anaerolineae bacterium]|jgi:hypothetical protein